MTALFPNFLAKGKQAGTLNERKTQSYFDTWQQFSQRVSDAQLQHMEELSKQSYTEEQRAKLAEWGKDWSEEDQRVTTQQWSAFTAELQRLTAAGTDPASPEAQALAAQWTTLISGFTHTTTLAFRKG
jgi:hypothetical protein